MPALLISTYDLGRQPFGLASAAAVLRAAGVDVTCLDLAKQRLDLEAVGRSDAIAFFLPMHTATRLAATSVPGPDDQQTGELPLRAGVRLQRHGGKPGDFGQRTLEIVKDLGVARRLGGGCERVNPRERLPGDRYHLGGRIQLHRAGAERDHRGVETDVLPLERLDVPHHLGLRVMAVEHRVLQNRSRSRESLRQRTRLYAGHHRA